MSQYSCFHSHCSYFCSQYPTVLARQPLNRVEAQAKRVQRAEQSLAKVEARGGRAGEVAAAVTIGDAQCLVSIH